MDKLDVKSMYDNGNMGVWEMNDQRLTVYLTGMLVDGYMNKSSNNAQTYFAWNHQDYVH